jgi:hypothetical protein
MASSSNNHGHEKHSPLEQFEISPYAHFETGIGDLAFTNSSLSMIITVLAITLFLRIYLIIFTTDQNGLTTDHNGWMLLINSK